MRPVQDTGILHLNLTSDAGTQTDYPYCISNVLHGGRARHSVALHL